MGEDIEYEGVWSTPAEGSHESYGTLRYSLRDGLALRLVGGPLGADGDGIIFGRTADAVPITCYKCHAGASQVVIGGLATSTVEPELVIVGAYLSAPDDVAFRELQVSFAGLDAWVGRSGLYFSPGSGFAAADVRCRLPEEIRLGEYRDWSLSLGFRLDFSDPSGIKVEANVSQTCYVRLTSQEEHSIEELLPVVRHVQNLLTFATNHAAIPVNWHAMKPVPDHSGREVLERLRLLRRTWSASSLAAAPRKPAHLFSLETALADNPQFAQSYFDEADLLLPVLDLYCLSLYDHELFVELEFLTLVQAVEAYHRRTGSNCVVPPEAHEARVAEILEAVPAQHRAWLMGRLSYTNEPNLRARLDMLYRDQEQVIGNEHLIPDGRSFINEVVEARNRLTHYDPSSTAWPADLHALCYLSEGLKAILRACLLSKLGFSRDATLDAVRAAV